MMTRGLDFTRKYKVTIAFYGDREDETYLCNTNPQTWASFLLLITSNLKEKYIKLEDIKEFTTEVE